MGTFIDNNGKLKNVLLIKAFSLSFLFVAVFVGCYLVAASVVAEATQAETGGILAVWGAPMRVALIGSLICCLVMLPIQDKVLVPVTFLFLAVYYVLFLVILASNTTGVDRAVGAQLISIYMLPVAVVGNIVSWGLYYLGKYLRMRRIRKRVERAAAERREGAV